MGMETSELGRRIAQLSPEQRALIELRLMRRGVASPQERIPRRGPTAASPLSFAQQRLWLLDQLVPGNPFYNVPSALRLSGPLDGPALERSLSEITRRHETLRTTFRS